MALLVVFAVLSVVCSIHGLFVVLQFLWQEGPELLMVALASRAAEPDVPRAPPVRIRSHPKLWQDRRRGPPGGDAGRMAPMDGTAAGAQAHGAGAGGYRTSAAEALTSLVTALAGAVGAGAPREGARPLEGQRTLDEQIRAFKEIDPNFSRPLYLDFLGVLYVRVARARATGEVASVAAYCAPRLLARWASEARRRTPAIESVEEVVVGASRVVSIAAFLDSSVRSVVDLESSFVEVPRGGGPPRGQWVKERWVLTRAARVLSKGPDDIATLRCPSCGASADPRADGTCTHCDKLVNRGDFHWLVVSADVQESAPRPDASALAGGGEEVGTDLPTVIAPDFALARRAFLARQPEFDWGEFRCRVHEVFLELARLWSAGEWEKARPFETDALFSSHRYWIETYRKAGLRNVLEAVSIDRLVPVKFELDAFYESITVRIFARMIDVTVDREGRVLAGSKTEPRQFSEYWTFIAGVGADLRRGLSLRSCPSCGAELRIGQTGECAHCQSLVTNGRFGWVLSRIEQDEVYGR